MTDANGKEYALYYTLICLKLYHFEAQHLHDLLCLIIQFFWERRNPVRIVQSNGLGPELSV